MPDPWSDITGDFPPEPYDVDFPSRPSAAPVPYLDDNRSGTSTIARARRGVEPTTATIADSQMPDFSGVMRESYPGVRAGVTSAARTQIQRESPGILQAGSFSLPDWGTDVSLSGMLANERARQMVEGGYRNRVQDIIDTEKQAQSLRALPDVERLGRAKTAAEIQAQELAPRRAEIAFQQQERQQQATQNAWDDFGRKTAALDQALAAYHQGGGQPGGGARGIDDRGYAIAKQQLFRELLAKLQTITRQPYGQLAGSANFGQEPFQMGGGAEPTYGASRAAEGE